MLETTPISFNRWAGYVSCDASNVKEYYPAFQGRNYDTGNNSDEY